MNNSLTAPVKELGELNELLDEIKRRKKPVLATGCVDAEKANFMEAVAEGLNKKNKVIITYDEIRAREIAADMKLYDKSALLYPAKDIMFFSADVHGNAIVSERLAVVKKITESDSATVVLSIEAGLDKVLPVSYILKNIITVKTGEILELPKFRAKLTAMGYEYAAQVSGKGQFSVRGGIIDIFSLTEETPYRIELWDDEVDTIRSFDVESQRSIENIDEILIYPASEMIVDEKRKEAGLKKLNKAKETQVNKLRSLMKTEEAARLNAIVEEFKDNLDIYGSSFGIESYISYFFDETESFIDYFGDDTIFFVDEPLRVEERGQAVLDEWRESMSSRLEKGYVTAEQSDSLYDYKEVLSKLAEKCVVLISLLERKTGLFNVSKTFDITAKNINPYNSNFPLLIKELTRYKEEKYKVMFVVSSGSRAERLAEDLRENGLNSVFAKDYERIPAEGEVIIVKGNLRKGFEYPLIRFAVISDGDIFGIEKKKRNKKRKKVDGASISSFSELHEGDYVIHESYGVGIYRGIEKIETDGVIKDYVKIEYDGGSSLYVLATGLDSLQKFSSKGGAKPKINKIGGKEWIKTKARVKASIEEIATDLVELYAKRQNETGFSFGEDTVWQREFEEMFPYQETEDQLSAIEDVKRDMESSRIMDRLICGDVGYGKTEIAIRAAFKAVSDGKQVVMLAPTTILAGQHYNTFAQRMKNFPISIELLSRFRSYAEVKKIKEKLANGLIDIVIGTHKVLASDVTYKNLGLLIIDEEQRFGVAHKEKVKKLRENIDVLTLSATPIPRTLHMSLSGIRDMSVLEEPPAHRLPIQTYVLEHNDEIIREAITREVARGGQVYYVYNRVNGIEDIAAKASKMLPDVSVAFAHGRMNERELERIMFDFISGDIDVLISTTIIETGLDISNVNTIIIDDADKMGLSQLYQLRGRVGRSTRTSYAFLMYKRDKALREIAEKRLAAIKEFTDLGSGFKIAMRDLELRGAGNLLGKSQSGHMEAVGYDLYCKMLNETIKKLKGEKFVGLEYETTVDIDTDAYIPASYIKNEVQRLEMYKRIAAVSSEEEVSDLKDELVDRYGDLPFMVNNLIEISYIRYTARKVFITSATVKGNEAKFIMFDRAEINTERIGELIGRYNGRLRIRLDKQKAFIYKFEQIKEESIKKKDTTEKRLVELKNLMEDFVKLLIKEK